MSRVIVSEVDGGLRQQIQAGQHLLVADEPKQVPGGTDAGPDPYSLLLSSLGACTAMTLRMYANHKNWPLEAIEVELTHTRVHARDCEDCPESEHAMIDSIEKVIRIRGPLDSTQLDRLNEIGERCPVHRTLMRPKQIKSRTIVLE